jgi:hypothetical protein
VLRTRTFVTGLFPQFSTKLNNIVVEFVSIFVSSFEFRARVAND